MTIKPNNLFHTPSNFDEVIKFINSASPRDDRQAAIVAAVMVWNLAAKHAAVPEETARVAKEVFKKSRAEVG